MLVVPALLLLLQLIILVLPLLLLLPHGLAQPIDFYVGQRERPRRALAGQLAIAQLLTKILPLAHRFHIYGIAPIPPRCRHRRVPSVARAGNHSGWTARFVMIP